MNSFNDVFVAVKELCKKDIVEASYNLFIEPLELSRIEDNTLYHLPKWQVIFRKPDFVILAESHIPTLQFL